MHDRQISRRSFVRVLAGVVAFVPAARSLAAFASDSDLSPDGRGQASSGTSRNPLKEAMRSRIASGDVLALEGQSVWIKDRYSPRLRLTVTDESIVWKGKYNQGANFQSYPHQIEAGDHVVARGRRNGEEFAVERMFVNAVNVYVRVDEVVAQQDEVQIFYTDSSKGKGVVRVRADYLIDRAVYGRVLSKGQRLAGERLQVIGLPLSGATILASNVLF